MTDFERYIMRQESDRKYIENELKDSKYFTELDGRTEMSVVKVVTLGKTGAYYTTYKRWGRRGVRFYTEALVKMLKIKVEDAAGEDSERYFVIAREYGKNKTFKRERRLTCEQANKMYKELLRSGYQD